MIPAAQAKDEADPRLPAKAFRVYSWALRNLDTIEFRPVKVLVVSHEVPVKKDTVIFALRRLCATGYLARGPRLKGEARQYRLYAAPVKAKAA